MAGKLAMDGDFLKVIRINMNINIVYTYGVEFL